MPRKVIVWKERQRGLAPRTLPCSLKILNFCTARNDRYLRIAAVLARGPIRPCGSARLLAGANWLGKGQNVCRPRLAPLRPSFHHRPTFFEGIATAVSGFGLVANGVRQRGFAKL